MTDEIKPDRVLVNPATAARWLAGTPLSYLPNRLNGDLIAQDAGDMRAGAWQADPELPVTLDEDGVVIDGVNDLTAVLFANVRIWMYVRTGSRSEGTAGKTQPDLRDFAREAASARNGEEA